MEIEMEMEMTIHTSSCLSFNFQVIFPPLSPLSTLLISTLSLNGDENKKPIALNPVSPKSSYSA
jgi:hypothetical protein